MKPRLPIGLVFAALVVWLMAAACAFWAAVIFGLSQVDEFLGIGSQAVLTYAIPFAIASFWLLIAGIFLLRGKDWARISVIAISLIWTLFWIYISFKSTFMNLLFLLPSTIVIFYLFTDNVSNYFLEKQNY